MPLTDAAVRAAKPKEKSYKLTDGFGMYLEVMPNGSKYWRLKYRLDGKEKRAALGVYPAVSLLAARKARDELKDQLRAGLDPTAEKARVAQEQAIDRQRPNQPTVADAMKEYWERVSPNKEGGRPEKLRLERFVRDFPKLAALQLSDFKTPHLAQWRDARLKGYVRPDGTEADPVTGASVNREINLIRNVFTIAREEWQWMEHNPFKGLRMPPDGAARTRRVDPWKEVRPIVRWLGYRTGHAPETKNQEVALAFLVALRTAMRAGEVLSLGNGNLDLKRRVATIKHKMQYLTGRPREIPLTRAAARLLQPVADREHCFTVASASLDTLFRKAKTALRIEGLHFHDSRAEALTRLSRKVDVMTLAKISGHKDLRLLQEHYYRETPEQIAARL
ncbi:tyrosine-type recombinase/integrase [Paraburkholderia terrae]|uniref:tyrosine-type recombinase/integrase n=1 Tax=Paraburkholderia terrae TaxID=311230 RepID=UPI00296AE8AF|nr:integrase family protein [Paraburkholderia terrae]MDW3660269.1 integrase family protein [Paraburkholderia terrae]